ncbi:hypothetical protein CKM354_000909200 [Cercospora kikuchii]|uniref:Uncharacterized protein n=1 Tax=Cercospora kikuchii TaxID=84275 RepID=A0A9P3FG01_9PEZI|nr:uncharacterized protein CKM354_000909200 [Cercospora kikuchii]GIZ45946.1 hypothetical protein CKM354_000909200 [Cercospora kikuchii]
MDYCKLCRRFPVRTVYHGPCAQHPSELCHRCFDQHVLATIRRTRIIAVTCKCGRNLSEAKLEYGMSCGSYRAYNWMKKNFLRAAAEQSDKKVAMTKTEEAIGESDEGDFVMVEKEDDPTGMNDGTHGDKKSSKACCVM